MGRKGRVSGLCCRVERQHGHPLQTRGRRAGCAANAPRSARLKTKCSDFTPDLIASIDHEHAFVQLVCGG